MYQLYTGSCQFSGVPVVYWELSVQWCTSGVPVVYWELSVQWCTSGILGAVSSVVYQWCTSCILGAVSSVVYQWYTGICQFSGIPVVYWELSVQWCTSGTYPGSCSSDDFRHCNSVYSLTTSRSIYSLLLAYVHVNRGCCKRSGMRDLSRASCVILCMVCVIRVSDFLTAIYHCVLHVFEITSQLSDPRVL